MAQTTKKVNFMINDDIRKEFERMVPPGERSKIVNEALRKELMTLKRKKLAERLMVIRSKGDPLSTEEIVSALKKGRERRVKL